MRRLLAAVQADPQTMQDEVWALRDAGRDSYTPAMDAVSRLLPPSYRPADLAAAERSWLRTTDGEPHHDPEPMRPALAWQRNATTLCRGPGDWPLLTIFGELPSRAAVALGVADTLTGFHRDVWRICRRSGR